MSKGMSEGMDNTYYMAVLDLEFLAFADNAVVTAGAVVATDNEGDIVEGHKGMRVDDAGIEFQIDNGGVQQTQVILWAESQKMPEILSTLEEVTLKEMVQRIADVVNHSTYVMERTVGADIPKLKYLAKLVDVPLKIPYYAVVEARSYYLGAGLRFLNNVWDKEYTAHNPYHDAMMDLRRVGYTRRVMDLTRGGKAFLQFTFSGGGDSAKFEELLEMQEQSEITSAEINE